MRVVKTKRIRITGIVQGVGFRPFVYTCANKNGIRGYVTNTSFGVEIVASGTDDRIRAFTSDIATPTLPHAVISSMDEEAIEADGEYADFEIRTSTDHGYKNARISPDLPVCEKCISELLDPGNRRYYYPYINCSHCGPRYTIVKDIPYDRRLTTMSAFSMCEPCSGEYANPENRRFHAQPNACYECGPVLELIDRKGAVLETTRDTPSSVRLFERCRSLIETGAIIAVKGIGGFHLTCDATNSDTVRALRSRKFREAKPFAVVVKNADRARAYAELSDDEETLLLSDARPIVLISWKKTASIAIDIAPRTNLIGIMLPYTPVHFLLFDGLDLPLVMTSANSSDEPIAYTNEDARSRLASIADYFLLGNREIHTRCDDSVCRVVLKKDYVLRRSRGYVPNPLTLCKPLNTPILALGAEQKNTICLGKENRAVLSHHIGDLDNPSAFASFEESITHLATLFNIVPEIVAYDLHPEYHNTKYLFSDRIANTLLDGLPTIGVQHHHAHIASCMAENRITGKVIGLAIDGTGWGPDETVWGGELLLADETRYTRLGCLLPVRMPGGAISIRKPWRMALSYLKDTFGNDFMKHIPGSWESDIRKDELSLAVYQLDDFRLSPLSSSCGRLFDSVAALSGVCTNALYEGQPAIELEQTIDRNDKSSYELSLEEKNDFLYISWKPVIEGIVKDLRCGEKVPAISSRFHNGLSEALTAACISLSRKTGVNRIALSGGCFMNIYLLSLCASKLERAGLTVFTHTRVPCNDGGISLGQLVIAAHGSE